MQVREGAVQSNARAPAHTEKQMGRLYSKAYCKEPGAGLCV